VAPAISITTDHRFNVLAVPRCNDFGVVQAVQDDSEATRDYITSEIEIIWQLKIVIFIGNER
jgi:hypothetical protein